jgi:hypothetical protein
MIYSTPWGKRKGFPPGCGGASTMGCLVFILIAGVIVYVGLRVGEAYWSFFEVRHKTQEALNWAVAGSAKSEAEIMQKVITNVTEVGVALSSENIQITQTTDTLTITVSWGQEVEFPYYKLPLDFSTTQTEEKRWQKGGLVIKGKSFPESIKP